MLTREELLKSKEYWLANIQNQLFNHIEDHMQKEGLNRTSLAEKLGVTKGYISQVLNGDFDHRLSKYIDLLIATNVVPIINFENLNEVIKKDSNSLTVHATDTTTIESYTVPNESMYWGISNRLTGIDKTITINTTSTTSLKLATA
jgi:transcriptional regulator with XRE-family HTH domain